MAGKEKSGISPGVAIVAGGLVLGAAGALLYALTARAAPPPPEEGLANLYGKVTDAETGEPIEGVLVSLNGFGVLTDSGGNYAFTDLTPDAYSGSASKDGYETAYF